MSDSTLAIKAPKDAQPTASIDGVAQPPILVTEPQPPVVITEQEVMLGTAAAARPRWIPITRRMFGALRGFATALQLPPPRPHYSHGGAYIERARMAREMGRL
jgi:hypothetical protein